MLTFVIVLHEHPDQILNVSMVYEDLCLSAVLPYMMQV